jgi:Zn-dependent protease
MEQNDSLQVETVPEEQFPPKPEITTSPAFSGTIISLVLFVAVYFLFFNQSISQLAILILVLFIHEAGHFLAMKYYGYSEVKMFFIPLLGALVTGRKEDVSQKQRSIILLAGPLPGIVIGIMLYFIGDILNHYQVLMVAGMFVFINVINLIPLNPLDGGKLIETLFFHDKEKVKNIFLIISVIITAFIGLKYEMYSLLIIPFIMITRINQNKRISELKDRLNVRGLDWNKSYESLSDKEYWLIREHVIEQNPLYRNVDPKDYTVSSREKQIAEQIRGLAETKIIKDLRVGGTITLTALWLLFLAVPAIIIGIAIMKR